MCMREPIWYHAAREVPMPQSVYGLLGLLHLILWIIAAVEIIRASRPVIEKVIWLLVILLLPLIGLILYYLLGRK